jgi:hypothetical protein
MAGGQLVYLMQTLRAIAETPPGFLAMEVLKVQIDLVVRIGRKIVTRAWHLRTHSQNGVSNFNRKMVHVIRVPRWVFDFLGTHIRACDNYSDSTERPD